VINLSAKGINRLSDNADSRPIIGCITDNGSLPQPIRNKHIYRPDSIACDEKKLPTGFAAYLVPATFTSTRALPDNVFQLPVSLQHLECGDVIRVSDENKSIRVFYRVKSSSNSLLVTERCNSFCLMCSQPPRKIDDSYLVEQILRAIPLMDSGSPEIMLSGGEPALLGNDLFRLLISLRDNLPNTAVHVLSNGRLFSDEALAIKAAQVRHHDLMFGIPLYADVADVHDFVVQAAGAFDETIKGILNLKRCQQKVEIRVVIHKQTYKRLPQLAEFISRNLLFADQVVLMGLEHMGFTKANLEALWIDPVDYQDELREAVSILSRARILTKIYNHQLCTLPEEVRGYSVKSISDWKNEYLPACDGCARKQHCGGFFFSTIERHSASITPLLAVS
jgi:His-Xaa-Ser system radical SAM maturase HxsC